LKKVEQEKIRTSERERRTNRPKMKRKRPSRRKLPTAKSTTPRKPGPMTEEQKRRISESIKKKWMDPEYRNAVMRSKERYLAQRIANGYVPVSPPCIARWIASSLLENSKAVAPRETVQGEV